MFYYLKCLKNAWFDRYTIIMILVSSFMFIRWIQKRLKRKQGEVKMRVCHTRLSPYRFIAGCCGLLWALYGCSVIGPQSIANGRAAYNEVINQTEDQQMLTAIVRNRYGETISMLAVTNVTANLL